MKNTTSKNSASSVSTLGEKAIKKSQIKMNKFKLKKKRKARGGKYIDSKGLNSYCSLWSLTEFQFEKINYKQIMRQQGKFIY